MQLFNGNFLITFEIFRSLFLLTNKKEKEKKDETELYQKSLLCKFVTDGKGKKIGESISIDKDIIVIKSGEKFLGVPLKHIEDTENTLLVKGLIDFKKAYEMGEKWRQKSFNEIDQKIESNGKNDGP
jgi:hypothetical protein